VHVFDCVKYLLDLEGDIIILSKDLDDFVERHVALRGEIPYMTCASVGPHPGF
jgi:hypothetical protein